MRVGKRFGTACALVLLALPGVASAQGKSAQAKEDGYNYHFDDDYMVGDTLSTTPPLIRIRHIMPRIMLLRPRASFVGEMLKSVEAL
jgi:hypothetical protein